VRPQFSSLVSRHRLKEAARNPALPRRTCRSWNVERLGVQGCRTLRGAGDCSRHHGTRYLRPRRFVLRGGFGRTWFPRVFSPSWRRRRPTADLLLDALSRDNLDPRVTEGLPWLAVAYPELDSDGLTRNARLRDRQNSLALVVALPVRPPGNKETHRRLAAALAERLSKLEPSRLATESTLCRESKTRAERKWLSTARSPLAELWNLLTDVTVAHLDSCLLQSRPETCRSLNVRPGIVIHMPGTDFLKELN
jgi:hypothetical protein